MSVEISLHAERFEEFVKSIYMLLDTVYARLISDRYADMIGLRLLYEMCYVGYMKRDTERWMSTCLPLIRDHPSVDYAMNIYRAINLGNYVQFIDLFTKADPLQTILVKCAMSRMRERALNVCRIAYLSLPVHIMQGFLNFKDTSTCIEYIKSHSEQSMNLDDAVVYFRKCGAATDSQKTLET